MSLRKYKTSKSNKSTWKYQKGGLVQYGGGGFNWEGIENSANIKGGLGIAGMAGGALQAVGGQDNFAAQGLGGAASGAAAGMMLGPLGAIVGGAIGGGIGLLKANAANKQQDAQERAQMQQRQGMIRMQQQSDATENPYAATFAYGGRVPGYDPMMFNIPEVAVYGKRPVKPIVPSNPSIYTPQGGGNWSYNGGADQWVNTVNKDKQGKPMMMSPEDYVKKGGPGYKQLIQANYRELYGKGGQVPSKKKNVIFAEAIEGRRNFDYRLLAEDRKKADNLLINYLKGYTGKDISGVAQRGGDNGNGYPYYVSNNQVHPIEEKEILNSKYFKEFKRLFDFTHDDTTEDNRYSPTDSSFIKEGNKLKNWYKKQGKETDLISINGLQDTTKINNALKNDNLDISIFGHSGNKMGGIPLDWWNKKLSKSNQDKILLGTCNGENCTDKLKNVKNLYRTDEVKWNGVNQNASNIEDAMFSTDKNAIVPSTGRYSVDRPTYPMGGMIPQGMPNAELEKQEVTQGPDGSMQKMNMPSHANATGKNQVALEPGTRIFSDKLKPKGEKKTYAQLADELRKQLEKYEQNLQA